MRLTEHMIIARSKESDLSTIRRINLWGCDLTDISIVKKMTNLEILALSVNNLSSLQPLEACTKLQELYLRMNNIQDFRQLLHLRKLPALTNLWLAENPCCARAGSNYRACVLSMLPNLKKLDDEMVTADDIDKANKLNCADLEIADFAPTVTKDSPKGSVSGVESGYEQLSSPYCSPGQGDAEQHVMSPLQKSSPYERVLTPEPPVQQQTQTYKDEVFKFEEPQAPGTEQAALESPQLINLFVTDSPNEPPQHFTGRYSLPMHATSRSTDGSAMLPMENQPLSEVSRSRSANHLAATHNNSMNMMPQVAPTDLPEFETTRSLQMEQALQYPVSQPQAISSQPYQMKMSLQHQQQQQQQRPAMQHPPPAYAATHSQQPTWPQQDAMSHLQPQLNQRSPASSKSIRWPATSHLDISQATEMDLSLKMPRSFSMQTINEHAEWEEGGRRSMPNPQRYSNADPPPHGYCRDNMNSALTGSVSARDAETENWDDGSITSRTRVMTANPSNREPIRHEMQSRQSRGRQSQVYQQRDTAIDENTQSSRTRYSQSTNQDYDGDDDLRSYRTGTTLSSRNLRRRNMHVLSALLCIIPELDLESLQVLEHNIVCRMDELSSS